MKIPLLVLMYLLSNLPTAANAANEASRPAPSCALNSIDKSQAINLEQFKGKVVYVDFWASWCGPCVQSFPYMNRLDRDFKDSGLQIVAVNLDENPEEAQTFLHNSNPQFLVVTDSNGHCAKEFEVQTMPTTYLVDRQGMVRKVHHGFRQGEAKEFQSELELLLKEQIN